MANNDNDRTIINVRERPLSQDINQAQAQLDRTLRDFLKTLASVRNAALVDSSVPTTGFFGDGFKVRISSPAAMTVQVTAGHGFLQDPADTPTAINGIAGLDDRSSYKPLLLAAPQTLAVPAADAVNPRIDIVEVKQDRRVQDPSSRDILDPGTGVFAANLVNKILAFIQDGRTSVNSSPSLQAINYKTGTPAGVPVAPAVTAGYIKIAEVDVPALSVAVNAGQIRDYRTILMPGGVRHVAFQVSVVYNAFTATVDRVIAPPGVQVAFARLATDLNATQSIFVFAITAGNLPTSGNGVARVQVSRNTTNPAGLFNPMDFADLMYCQYTALDGTRASYARTNNVGVDVAVNQPALLIGLRLARLDTTIPSLAAVPVATYVVNIDADI